MGTMGRVTTHRATRSVPGLTFSRRTRGGHFRSTLWRAELDGYTISTFDRGGTVADRWYPYLRDWREACCDEADRLRFAYPGGFQ